MRNVARVTIRKDLISGGMGRTVTTRLMETVGSSNRYSEMHLSRDTEKVTRGMADTTIVAETETIRADGVMAVGPGKFYLQSTLPKNAAAYQGRGILLSSKLTSSRSLGPNSSPILNKTSNLMQENTRQYS